MVASDGYDEGERMLVPEALSSNSMSGKNTNSNNHNNNNGAAMNSGTTASSAYPSYQNSNNAPPPPPTTFNGSNGNNSGGISGGHGYGATENGQSTTANHDLKPILKHTSKYDHSSE